MLDLETAEVSLGLLDELLEQSAVSFAASLAGRLGQAATNVSHTAASFASFASSQTSGATLPHTTASASVSSDVSGGATSREASGAASRSHALAAPGATTQFTQRTPCAPTDLTQSRCASRDLV